MNIVNIAKKKFRLFRKWTDYIYYQSLFNNILERKKNKKKLKVLFFVMSIDMWKLDDLFKLLLEDPQFEPYIIPQLLQRNTKDQNERIQNTLRIYFNSIGFPFIDAVDMKSGVVFNAYNFEPDIVFCSQPYNAGLKEHRIHSLWKDVLFAYIPYCINQELNPIFYTGLYQNICWRYYCQFNLNKEYESTLLYNKGKNMVVVGHLLFEQIEKNRGKELCLWKDKEHKKIRLIWAPHHSVLPTDELGYANFLDMADSMIEFANKYRDKIEIAFKPHPILKEKLIFLDDWGEERTKNYYNFWKDSSNTILSEGSYVELFMTSDAMIHDSSSFICEYIYTKKPVMFLTKNPDNLRCNLNDLGKSCFDLHYKGITIGDIAHFLNEIIIGEKDPLKVKRNTFFETVLKIDSNTTVSNLIYNDMKSSLGRK